MSPLFDSPRIPLIDMSLFDLGGPWRDQVAAQLDSAASEFGVFSIVGHGIDPAVVDSLAALGPRASVQDNEAVLDYTRMMSGLSHKLMAALGRGLRLGDSYFVDRYTGNPITSLQILRYPADLGGNSAPSALEHRDSGLLTVRYQDEAGGLQVNTAQGWIEVPAIPGAFVVSVGEKLARLSSGRYVAADHRVGRAGGQIVPFAFDLPLDVVIEPIPVLRKPEEEALNRRAAGSL